MAMLKVMGTFKSFSALRGRLAQLARASGLHPEGHRFDPYSAHQKFLSENHIVSIDADTNGGNFTVD